MNNHKIVICRKPNIVFMQEPSHRFPDKPGYRIDINNGLQDSMTINSGWCHEGWWNHFDEELFLLRAGKIEKIGYGGSEGGFSQQFEITRFSFYISINNFGELMGIDRTFKIKLSDTKK